VFFTVVTCGPSPVAHLNLRIRHESRLRRGQIGRDIGRKFGRVEKDEAVPGGHQIAGGHRPRHRRRAMVGRFAYVGLQGGDIHQRSNLRIGAGNRDYGAAIAVTAEDDRTLLLVDDAFRCRDILVVGKPKQVSEGGA
jgi:hypothetical protein